MPGVGIKNQGLTSMLERQLLGRQAEYTSKLEKNSLAKSAAPTSGEGSFVDTLKNAIQNSNDLQVGADTAAKNFAAGKGSLHETMIAMEKADLALRTITSVRGKLIEAYQEIIKMPV